MEQRAEVKGRKKGPVKQGLKEESRDKGKYLDKQRGLNRWPAINERKDEEEARTGEKESQRRTK